MKPVRGASPQRPGWRGAWRALLECAFAGARAAHGRRGTVAHRPRVLVVDDDPRHLDDASALLAFWGIAPTLATDGAEAADLACARPFDLILMDLQMPGLDGLAATLQIRRHEQHQRRARVPVLAYTSAAPGPALLRDCGIDGVLDKPCSADEMAACLLHWCPADSMQVAAEPARIGQRLTR